MGAISSISNLLSKYEIRIPAIQREYVQGSEEENIKLLRKELLNDIFKALGSEENVLNLGIIYGVVAHGKIFFPTDGQQRLTTLLLLYWYLEIKGNHSIPSVKFTYEIRHSANSFFRELLNEKRINTYQELLEKKNKHEFIDTIKNEAWFKTSWFSDITVVSVLNTIGEIIDLKIKNKDIKRFREKIIQKQNSPICFYFLEESYDGDFAYEYSSKNFVKMNSRGKMLETFENIKARMEIIERSLNNTSDISGAIDETTMFTWKYDTEYINFFYDRVTNSRKKNSLEEKTKKINEETINMLINLYNGLVFSYENQNLQLLQFKDKESFYYWIYNLSVKGFENEELKEFCEEYFKLIDIVINSLNKQKQLASYIEGIFGGIREYAVNNIQDNLLIGYTKYIFYYFMNHNQCVCEHKMDQLKYVLDNLDYEKWKMKSFSVNNNIFKEIARAKDTYSFFVVKEHKDIEQIFELNTIKFGIGDIKVRLKEQHIKFNIINEMNRSGRKLDYNFFNETESLSSKRMMHYLLFITGMWHEAISDTKIEMLLMYLKIAKVFYCKEENSLLWRKIVAIISHSRIEKLCSYKEINRRVNEYENGKNIWYWEDSYYFIKDSILDNLTQYELKISRIKCAYDYISESNIVNISGGDIQLNTEEFMNWCKLHFDESYNSCWLKYAIDRDYEELLTNRLSYSEDKMQIYIEIVEDVPKPHIPKKVNFFARVLFKDESKKNNIQKSKYSSIVWDYESKRVSSYILQKGIILNDLKGSLINQFAPSLLWFEHLEKYLNNDKERYRCFLYYCYNFNIPNVENAIYILQKDCILICLFYESVKYNILKYEIENSPEKQKTDYSIKEFHDFRNECTDIQDFGRESGREYSYVYNENRIYKYRYYGKHIKGEVDIELCKFEDVKEDILQFHNFSNCDYAYGSSINWRNELSTSTSTVQADGEPILR